MIILYRFVWWALLPVIRLIHIVVSTAHAKFKTSTPQPKWVLALSERFTRQTYPVIRPKPLWIHCASGEFENMRAFIRLTRASQPSLPILLTYSSPTLKSWLNKNFDLPEVRALDAICAHPFDTKKDVSRFIEHFDPRALIISRTDLWPEALQQLRARNIPAVLSAAALGKGQKKNNILYRKYVRWNLNLLTEIWCCTQSDALNYQALGTSTPCLIVGEPRFDQAAFRVHNPSKVYRQRGFNSILKSEVPLLFASTWPQDDFEIEKCLNTLKHHNIQFIWAPHEISPFHLEHIKNKLTHFEISFQLSTDLKTKVGLESQALLVNEVGILADLYAHTKIAFVGGSFKKQVHSVLEPLAQRNLVLVGPYHQNSREAIDFQNLENKGYPWVQSFRSGEELGPIILQRLSWNKPTHSIIEDRTGASALMYEKLHALFHDQ